MLASLRAWLSAHIVADWRDMRKWSSMRLHGLAMLVAAVYQIMPVLDPQVAAMLPAPLAAKAVGLYALIGAIFRIMQLRRPT